jgi:hypothetical protein
VIQFVLSATASAQADTGLPYGLDYLMSKAQVATQLSAMAAYRVESGDPNTVAYVIPAPDTNTKNGLFLEFNGNELVEISSTKSSMDRALYDRYLDTMLAQAKQWIAAAMSSAMEDKLNTFYLYRDLKSYVSISGSRDAKARDKFSVSISFMEKKHFEKTNPRLP